MLIAGGALAVAPAAEKSGEKAPSAPSKTTAKDGEAKATGTGKPADSGKKAEAKKPSDSAGTAQAAKTHAAREAAKLSEAQQNRLLELLNKGDDAALEAIPGIGAVRAKSIKKARPLKTVEDLIAVEGVGEATYDETIKWAKSGMKNADDSTGAKPKKAADSAAADGKTGTPKKK
jgi:DNA uptake protein ComE-like DNA-binding protein